MPLSRWQASIVDDAGNVQPLASIEVRREISGQPLVALYSDRDGASSLGNPFLADADGFAAFHVAGGAYQITATLGAFSRTWRYVPIGTNAEQDTDEDVGLLVSTYTDSITLALTDASKVIEMNKATAVSVTVPPNADVAFPIPSFLDIAQIGAGQVTVVAGSGVTIRSKSGNLKIAAQYGAASLYKRATNEWVLIGDLTA